MDAFFALHDTLPREGPGDRDSLDWALAVARPPPDAAILDAGCGPGADIPGLLDHAPDGQVLGVDTHARFVAAARAALGEDPRVTISEADMLGVPGPFDLIWAAGTIYFAGVETALAAWAPKLRPGGRLVFSQLVWRVPDPPEAVREAFRDVPGIGDLDALRGQVPAAGWRVIAARILPEAAWETYYRPLEARAAQKKLGASPAMKRVIAETEAEIALWRRHRDAFGYAQVVAEPA